MNLPYYQTTDDTINRLQTKWISILNPLLATVSTYQAPFLDGVLLSNVSLITGAQGNPVQHNLGKQPTGYMLIDVLSAGDPIISRVSWDKNFISLKTNVAATVSIWVF